MAENSIILRPVSDLFINAESNAKYNFHPAETQSAYLLINEEVMDGDSTYIDVERVTTNEDDVTFGFGFDFSPIPKNSVLTGMSVTTALDFGGAVGSHKSYVYININGTDFLIESYSSGSYDATKPFPGVISDDALSIINEYITTHKELPPMYVSVSLQPADTVTKDGVAIKISQLYLTVTYEEVVGLNIHRKISGQWLQALTAYKKQGGVWVEITEDECKSILQSSLVAKG